MSLYLEKAKELRAVTEVHYNCAQAVVCAFTDIIGVDQETAFCMGANFGSGMKMGSVCGAVTGALMVLGLCGVKDGAALQELYRRVKENHEGCLDCKDLLRLNAEKGMEKKRHCDGMVFELTEITEELLRKYGVIQ